MGHDLDRFVSAQAGIHEAIVRELPRRISRTRYWAQGCASVPGSSLQPAAGPPATSLALWMRASSTHRSRCSTWPRQKSARLAMCLLAVLAAD